MKEEDGESMRKARFGKAQNVLLLNLSLSSGKATEIQRLINY